jgi:glycosyltransferase involved in cell wall biosynthesis
LPSATIAITTKDRRDDLRRALASAFAQTADVEVLVIDDGSTDGTAEMVAEEFPEAVVHRSERSLGLIAQRNRAAELASAPVVVSIDDDAELVSPRTVEHTLAELDHPRVGAVAIPHVDVSKGPSTVLPLPPDNGRVYATVAYVGTAHALRRDLFLELGGYWEGLFHQAEESDFCARMLRAGYVVRLGTAEHILHHESPRRVSERLYFYGRRNDVLFAWHNVPMPYLVGRLAKVTVHGLLIGLRGRRLGAAVRGLWRGYAEGVRDLPRRDPLPRDLYRLSRRLRRQLIVPLEEVEPELPAGAP